MTTLRCQVVIAAAGNGSRFISSIPKQFHLINSQAIISHTVEKFVRESCVETVVVVAPESEEYFDKMKEVLHKQMLETNKIIITHGGKFRHRSIIQGLLCLKNSLTKANVDSIEWMNEIVIIHDGVRPFINSDDITRVIAAAQKHKAAGLVKPLVSTVLKLDSDDVLEYSLDRLVHWSSEMPQAFNLGIILQSYEKCSEYDFEHGTECLYIALKYGSVSAKLLKGDPNRLWKITLQKDILAASILINESAEKLLVLPDEIAQRQNIILGVGDVTTCSLGDLHNHISRPTHTFCLLHTISHLIPSMQHFSNILQSFSTGSCRSIIFLLNSELTYVDEDVRSKYMTFCQSFLRHKIVSQCIIKKDVLREGLKDLMLLLQTFGNMPTGQVLYF